MNLKPAPRQRLDAGRIDLRTAAEIARYELMASLGILAQYVAGDPSPSILDRFRILRELIDPENWLQPRIAAERINAVVRERSDHTSFVTYLGQAAAAIERYALAANA